MNEQVIKLRDALVEGDIPGSEELARAALASGVPPQALIQNAVKAAAEIVGQKYESGEYFLANLVRCGDSFKAALGQIEEQLKAEAAVGVEADRVVIATVEGDIHDIGKDLVATFLQGDGFAVEDMGVDVSAERMIDKAVEIEADIIALSCLMSVTRDGVKKVCQELESRGLRDRFIVLAGGAATNEKWAKQIGCDGWAATATEACRVARNLIGMREEA